MPKTLSVKSSDAERIAWETSAEKSGLTLHAWMKQALNLVAERDLAEIRRTESAKQERENLKRVMTGTDFVFRGPDPKKK